MKKFFLSLLTVASISATQAQLLKVANLDQNNIVSDQIGLVSNQGLILSTESNILDVNLSEVSGGAEIGTEMRSLPISGAELEYIGLVEDDEEILAYSLGAQKLIKYGQTSYSLEGFNMGETIESINLVINQGQSKTFLFTVALSSGDFDLRRSLFDGSSFTPIQDFTSFSAEQFHIGESSVYYTEDGKLYKKDGFTGVSHGISEFDMLMNTGNDIVFIKEILGNVFTINNDDEIYVSLFDGSIAQEYLSVSPVLSNLIDIKAHNDGYLLAFTNNSRTKLFISEYDENFSEISLIGVNYPEIKSITLTDLSADGMMEILVSNEWNYSLFKLTEDNLELNEELLNTPQILTQGNRFHIRGVHEVEYILADTMGRIIQEGAGNITDPVLPGAYFLYIECESGAYHEKTIIK